MLIWKNRPLLLMDTNNDGGAGGNGGGAGGTGNQGGVDDILSGQSGGQGQGGGQGNSNAGGSGGQSNGGNGGAGGAGGNTSAIPQNWKETLPPELRDLPFMKNVSDVPTLVKNLQNAQSMVGLDKLPIPGKNATPEQWSEVFKRLGVPEKVDEYKFDLDKETKVDESFLKELTKFGFENKILPNQMGKLVDWFSKVNETAFKTMAQEQEGRLKEEHMGLKREWGAAYNEKIEDAKLAVREFADDALQKQLAESGLGKDVRFMRMMSAAGAVLREKGLKGGEGGSGDGTPTVTEARTRINEIKGNMKHPYWNPDDPGHQAAKKEYTSLFQYAFPQQKES